MNKGIDLCEGDWLYFLGADDELFDENVLFDLFEQGAFSQERVVYGNVYVNGDAVWARDKSVYDGVFNLTKLLDKNICHQAIFYPKHIVSEIGYFNTKYEVTADYDYNLRCFAKQDFLYVDRIIANFSAGGKSSLAISDITSKEFATNIISYFNLNPDNPKYYKPKSPFYKRLSYYKHILKVRLNPFTEDISTGISLFTAVKNKDQSFEEALKTWVVHKEIDEYYKGGVNVIDSANIAAIHIANELKKENLLNDSTKTEHHFYVSNYTKSFEKCAQFFFQENIKLEEVNIFV